MPIKKRISKRAANLRATSHLLFTNFFEHNVSKNAAALAYYLLFALFPLLIFISNLLGLLDLDITEIIKTLHSFLPGDVVAIIENYLDYTSNNSSKTLMWFSLVFSVWFPMRAAKGLMDDIRCAYGLQNPDRPVVYMVKQLIYTVVFLIVIVITLIITVAGENVLVFIKELLPDNTFKISDSLLTLWQYLRFLPAAILMFLSIGTLYAVSLEKKTPLKTLLPGILAALLSWLIVSIGFSFYVENFANYSVIYGTLGAVIVLVIWLYMTAITMILGAELNAALQTVHSENAKD